VAVDSNQWCVCWGSPPLGDIFAPVNGGILSRGKIAYSMNLVMRLSYIS